ncbi:unnamed protein product [Mycena citricolor]|uniref:Uncharacterized protein n=1 Tax=Mycena citricolor TaxID=2018698 RepID=A0AAD2K6H2_9AGAR|nr:unnamed protein product [Mycena citricolor]
MRALLLTSVPAHRSGTRLDSTEPRGVTSPQITLQ